MVWHGSTYIVPQDRSFQGTLYFFGQVDSVPRGLAVCIIYSSILPTTWPKQTKPKTGHLGVPILFLLVYGISTIILTLSLTFTGHLVGCLAGSWVLICLTLIKGIQSYGKEAYVITLSPYFVLSLLLGRLYSPKTDL